MKVIVSGPADGYSGWSRATELYILALDSVGINVIPQLYKLNDDPKKTVDRINDLSTDVDGAEAIIHCGLPHLYSQYSLPQIGIFFTETDYYGLSHWPGYINIMDRAVVPNFQAHKAALDSGINIPIDRIPPPTIPLKEVKPGASNLSEETNGDFLFYFIGELSHRKNLGALIKAFHLEFTPNEPVSLVLKVNKYGLPEEEIFEATKQKCQSIKDGLRIRKDYKKEVIISSTMSSDQMLSLHQYCDCLVNTSFGEAWGFPIIDAIQSGNNVICNNVGGPADYLPKEHLCNNYKVPCFGMTDQFDMLFTGYENWWEIDINDLRAKMRNAYNCSVVPKVNFYTLESVGNKLKESLLKCI